MKILFHKYLGILLKLKYKQNTYNYIYYITPKTVINKAFFKMIFYKVIFFILKKYTYYLKFKKTYL